MSTKVLKAKIVSVRELPDGSERLIQEMIAADPSILGLGNLALRGKERIQPSGGRLDILLEDENGESWYEVEVQLGKTNESHIIRTIEYWDRERRRYPDIRHTAVIVAEEITGRFFNVISLFNQTIPIVALKMIPFQLGSDFGIIFTKVLDHEPRAVDADAETLVKVDRAYWEQRSSPFSLNATETLINFCVKSVDSTIEVKFNKPYIGTVVRGLVSNFATFRPQKKALRITLHCAQREALDKQLDETEIQWLYENGAYPGYRLSLSEKELKQYDSVIKLMLVETYRDVEGEPPIAHKGDA